MCSVVDDEIWNVKKGIRNEYDSTPIGRQLPAHGLVERGYPGLDPVYIATFCWDLVKLLLA